MDNKILPLDVEEGTKKETTPEKKGDEKEWTNPIEFLMTCISKIF